VLPTGLFKNRTCNLALVTQNIQWLILMGTSFTVSVFLQEVRGYSAIAAGVIFTATTVGLLLASLAAGRWARKNPQKMLIVLGFFITMAGIALLLLLIPVSTRTSPSCRGSS
jgi:MFS family permease